MEKRHRINPTIRQFARELHQPQTPTETTLWSHLRNRSFKYKFIRQHSIDFSIIDFYCAEAILIIEIDGASHLEREQQEYDQARTEYLQALGYKVIRFTNNDIRYNIHAILMAIMEEVENRIKIIPHPSLLP